MFPWLAAAGGVHESELLRTFNCGVGGILIVDSRDVDEVLGLVRNEGATVIGKVVQKETGNHIFYITKIHTGP